MICFNTKFLYPSSNSPKMISVSCSKSISSNIKSWATKKYRTAWNSVHKNSLGNALRWALRNSKFLALDVTMITILGSILLLLILRHIGQSFWNFTLSIPSWWWRRRKMQIKIKEGSVNKHFLNPMSAITLLKKKEIYEKMCVVWHAIWLIY